MAAALAPLCERLRSRLAKVEPWRTGSDDLESWRPLFRRFSAFEAWQVHGAWIETAKPPFAPAFEERFSFAKGGAAAEAASARAERQQVAATIRAALGEGGLL